MKVCIHMEERKISNLVNRLQHEFLGLASPIILRVLFCKVNVILLLNELPSKLFHSLLWNKNKKMNWCLCYWYETSVELHKMFYLTQESFDEYNSYTLNGYQILNQ
jgi:hypothetical protein